MSRRPKAGRSLLVIAAKAPIAGQVKTRLCSHLSPATAAELYRCSLQDRLDQMQYLEGIDRAVAYTPEDAEAYFKEFRAQGYDLFPQQGADLGARLIRIFEEKFAAGYDAVCVMDSDSPDLPRAMVRQSFHFLTSARAEAVFGPCYDGGYYLVGLREPQPELFQDIPWSSTAVLEKTLAAAAERSLQAELLAFWNDLDTFEDLLAFYHQYPAGRCGQDRPGARTFAFLSKLEAIHQAVA